MFAPRVKPTDRSWYILGVLQKAVTVDMLLDTGCTHSLIPMELYKAIPEGYRPPMKETVTSKVIGFSGVSSTVLGLVPLTLAMNKVQWVVEFLVVDGPASPILGMDFFLNNGIVLDFNNTEKVTITDMNVQQQQNANICGIYEYMHRI